MTEYTTLPIPHDPPAVVYVATFPNGKRYVGKTTSLDSRRSSHLKAAQKGSPLAFHAAIRKHGEPLWHLAVSGITDSIAYLFEIEMIRRLDTLLWNGRGYNMTTGGEGRQGYHMSEAQRREFTENQQAWWLSLSPEEQERFSRDPERVGKISATMKDYAQTEAGRKNLRRAAEKADTPERRAKSGAFIREYNQTDEAKAALAKARQASSSPEVRAKAWETRRKKYGKSGGNLKHNPNANSKEAKAKAWATRRKKYGPNGRRKTSEGGASPPSLLSELPLISR